MFFSGAGRQNCGESASEYWTSFNRWRERELEPNVYVALFSSGDVSNVCLLTHEPCDKLTVHSFNFIFQYEGFDKTQQLEDITHIQSMCKSSFSMSMCNTGAVSHWSKSLPLTSTLQPWTICT